MAGSSWKSPHPPLLTDSPSPGPQTESQTGRDPARAAVLQGRGPGTGPGSRRSWSKGQSFGPSPLLQRPQVTCASRRPRPSLWVICEPEAQDAHAQEKAGGGSAPAEGCPGAPQTWTSPAERLTWVATVAAGPPVPGQPRPSLDLLRGREAGAHGPASASLCGPSRSPCARGSGDRSWAPRPECTLPTLTARHGLCSATLRAPTSSWTPASQASLAAPQSHTGHVLCASSSPTQLDPVCLDLPGAPSSTEPSLLGPQGPASEHMSCPRPAMSSGPQVLPGPRLAVTYSPESWLKSTSLPRPAHMRLASEWPHALPDTYQRVWSSGMFQASAWDRARRRQWVLTTGGD